MAKTPTRLYNGVTTDSYTQPLGMYVNPDPVQVCEYVTDFNTYLASDWTIVAGGAGSSTALSSAYGAGGWALITTATSGTESMIGNGSHSFTATTSSAAGMRTWFKAKVTLDATVANPDYAIGLMKGTPGLTSPTDGVYFTKATTATVWSLVVKSAVSGATSTFALPASTVPTANQTVELAYYFNGVTIDVFFNGVKVYTVTDLTNLPGPTILHGPALANVFHTATSILAVDYVMAATELAR